MPNKISGFEVGEEVSPGSAFRDHLNQLVDAVNSMAGGGREPLGLHPNELGTYTTPDSIGDNAEGSETADTATWDVWNQTAGKDGLEFYVYGRSVYNHAGDKILYGFKRKVTIDSIGHVRLVGAEERYTIDVLESC